MNSLKSLIVFLVLVVLAATWIPARMVSSQAAYTAISIPAAGPWYVATGGNDANDCLTPATPCATINAAIGKATAGDTVYVAEGTYTGEGEQVVLINKDITLSGGWDASFTSQDGISTINGSALRRGILIFSGIAAIINRFVITKGATDYDEGASGIFLLDNSSLTLNDSSVLSNTSTDDSVGGDGIGGTATILILNRSSVSYNMGSGIDNVGNMTINSSSISYNKKGGIRTGGNATLNDSAVDHNQGSGILNFGLLTLNNSTVSANSTNYGGGILNCCGQTNSAVVTINNSTITGNSATEFGGGIYTEAGQKPTITQIQNSILAGNISASNPDCAGDLQSSGYNLIGNITGTIITCNYTPGIGDLTGLNPNLGPLIGSQENPQYHPLLPGSPAIDAGNPAGCTGSTGDLLTDQRGAPRVGNCDIGAYEYALPGPPSAVYAHSGTGQNAPLNGLFELPLAASVLDSIGSPVEGITVTFAAPVTGASGIFTDTGDTTTTALTISNSLATSAAFTANGITGSYSVTATVNGVAEEAIFQLRNGAGVLYVSTTGDNGNTCIEPTQPCATINAAIGYASPGDTVFVAEGTYTGEGAEVVLIDKSITLSGGWDSSFNDQGGMSTIDGEVERRDVVVPRDSTVVIEYFVIQNSWFIPNYGSPLDGIFNAGTLTLNNCLVQGNSSLAIENHGSITLNKTSVTGNGQGIFNENGSLILNDSLVSQNSNEGNITTAGGGGIYTSGGNVTLNRSAVVNNINFAGAGGIDAWWSNVTLNNSTISGNQNASGSFTRGGGGILFSLNGAPGIKDLSINNSTIVNNTSDYGGGLATFVGAERVFLQNSIIANNRASEGPDCRLDGGPMVSAGYNLLGNLSGCNFQPAAGDLVNMNPLEFPLTGSPAYHPLLPGSPAIDAGNPNGCTDHLGNPLSTDQRGVARLGRCDIGAYEYDPNNDPLSYVYLSSLSNSYCPVVYSDDFSDPNSGWPINTTNPTYRLEYLNGAYRMLLNEADHWVVSGPDLIGSEYVLSVDAVNVSGVAGTFGFVFAASDDLEQFYTFEIDLGNYYVYRYDSGDWTQLAAAPFGPSFSPGVTISLKLERVGAEIRGYVNGHLYASVTDGTYTGPRQVGLIISTYAQPNLDVHFDNFVMTPGICAAGALSSLQIQLPKGATASAFADNPGWIWISPMDRIDGGISDE